MIWLAEETRSGSHLIEVGDGIDDREDMTMVARVRGGELEG